MKYSFMDFFRKCDKSVGNWEKRNFGKKPLKFI